MAGAGVTTTGSPCGACKFLRRRCAAECVFAPYFCAEDGASQFAAIHKVFGASNAAKLLQQQQVVALQAQVAHARTQAQLGAATAMHPLLQQQLQQQAWQVAAAADQHDHQSMTSTQSSSGCYSGAHQRSDGSSLHGAEMYCGYGEQEEGSY
uniref:Uncharacterized protein n=1 Tax=Aegilops tauschii TaxID=37682 RepID=N1R4P2_AEGTA